MSEFNPKFIKYLCLLLILKGCAYFNTFYNAEEHFETAERIRIENLGSQIPSRAILEYKKSIEKSEKVLREYPESKYVKDARILKGKSHYFLREYDIAVELFNKLIQIEELENEAKYWLALCKWKNLKPQPAINELENLINEVESNEFKSRIYLSLGEIYLSIDSIENAYDSFENGLSLSDNRILREQVYFQIAEISFQRKNFDKALESYKKVIANSLSKNRIQESNLRIVQIYRLQNEKNLSKNLIMELVLDENFIDIRGDLELELVKIEKDNDNMNFVIESLDRIGQEYENTKSAIESFFLLSEIYLSNPYLDFEKSLFYLNESMKQNINSPIKVIVDKNRESLFELISLNKKVINSKNSNNEYLFSIGEILAFRLSKPLESKVYFEKIIKSSNEDDLMQKSFFNLYVINKQINNPTFEYYRDEILKKYPNSDYAQFIIQDDNLEIGYLPAIYLDKAEMLKDSNLNDSINFYKDVIKLGGNNESSKIAAYFLGNYYELSNLDSSKYYYNIVVKNYPESLQADKANLKLEILNAQ